MNLFAFIQKWSTSVFATQLKSGFVRWSPSTMHSELSHPVQTPALPYVGPISGGLKAGVALYLQGVVGTKGPRFDINFKTGQSDKDDIAFHFNPRHNSDVVMNNCGSGGWGAEEFGPDNPFKPGEAFEMFIIIKPEGYQVHVNGKEYYLFKHRIPLEKVSALNIAGDLVVKLLGFIQNWNRLGFLRWGLSTIQSEFSLPVHNPTLPYVRPIPEGLKEGLALYFQGVAATTGEGFAINFKSGQSDKDDTAFHFNPRYNSNVVMNSCRNGEWEAEEFGPDNPFKMGEAFHVFIVIKPEGYQVYVNSKEYYLFKHRIPLEKVSAITIVGHVTMNLFAFIQKWSTSSFATQLRLSSSTMQSQLSFPVQNPALPYVGPISGGLKAGVALCLKGVVGTGKCPGFNINFRTGKSDTDDIAFHFNPRHNSNVVMNSCRNGQWEAEEFASVNPFKMGEAFEMFIVIKLEGYQVYVNRNEIYLFKHRIPLEKVSVLNIGGDVVINLCDIIQDWSKSSFAMEFGKFVSLGSSQFEILSFQSDFLLPVQNPKIPYIGPISGGVKPGMSFFLHGVVASNANQFAINFLTGPSENHDIAFHFNPRLNDTVVMNTCRNGKWEDEERGPIGCFKNGEAFELLIFFTPHEYKVHVNGKELFIYKHRMPLDKVAALSIREDVSVGIFGFMMGKPGICVSPPTIHHTPGGMAGPCHPPSHHPGHHPCHPHGHHPGHPHGHPHGHPPGHPHGHPPGHPHGHPHGHPPGHHAQPCTRPSPQKHCHRK